jgi:hypothetical protein
VARSITSSPLGLPDSNLVLLLTQRDPDPEPADHFNKGEGEEDAILKRVAAPGRWVVRGVVGVGRGVG